MAKTKTTTTRQTKTKTKTKTEKEATADDEVTICRRRSNRRETPDDVESESIEAEAIESDSAEPEKTERRKVQRRRQIDPTTCERDYTDDEIEFMHALDEYKRANGRMFPTCSEILEVVRDLGYVRTIDGIPVLPELVEPSVEQLDLVTASEAETL